MSMLTLTLNKLWKVNILMTNLKNSTSKVMKNCPYHEMLDSNTKDIHFLITSAISQKGKFNSFGININSSQTIIIQHNLFTKRSFCPIITIFETLNYKKYVGYSKIDL